MAKDEKIILVIQNEKMLRAAFEHGKTVQGYLMSNMPEKYAPLTFESWLENYKTENDDDKRTAD